jgi:hypothetical protein
MSRSIGPEVMALEHQYRTDSVISALFPPDFADALSRATQRKATELGVQDVRGATVRFSAVERSGILIRRVDRFQSGALAVPAD